MDFAVGLLVREIALGGLCGVPLTELWEHFDLEMKLRTDTILPFMLDEFMKGKLWGELLRSTHISHFCTSEDVPECSLLDIDTIINEPPQEGEGTVGALGFRKNGWEEVDIQNKYCRELKKATNRKEKLILLMQQVSTVESKGNKYVLVANQKVRNRVLGLYGGGHWKVQPLKLEFPTNPVPANPFRASHPKPAPKPTDKQRRETREKKKRKQNQILDAVEAVIPPSITEQDDELLDFETLPASTYRPPTFVQPKKESTADAMDTNESNTSFAVKIADLPLVPVEPREEENNEMEIDEPNVTEDEYEEKNSQDTDSNHKSDEEETVKAEAQEFTKKFRDCFEFEFLDYKVLSGQAYCILELIGKQRRAGFQQALVHTIGKGKLAHATRKLLHRNTVDRLSYTTKQKGKTVFQQFLWIKSQGPSLAQIAEIQKFHPSLDPTKIFFTLPLQYHLCALIDQAPDKTVVERHAGIYYRANVAGDSHYRWATLLKLLSESGFINLISAMVNGKKVPCIRLDHSVIDENGDSLVGLISDSPWNKSDNDDDSDDETTTQIPVGMGTLRYIYQLIEESGTTGITQPQLQKITNISAKYMLKQTATLVKHFGVKSLAEHAGRQICYTLYTKENYDEKLASVNIENLDKISSLKPIKSRKKELPKPQDLGSDDDEEEFTNKPSTPTLSPAPTRHITLQRLQRRQRILEILEQQKIAPFSSIKNFLSSHEGETFKADKKSIQVIVDELEAEGKISSITITIPLITGGIREFKCIKLPELTPEDEIFQDFIHQTSNNLFVYHPFKSPTKVRPFDTKATVTPLNVDYKPDQCRDFSIPTRQGFITSLYLRSKLLHQFLLSRVIARGEDTQGSNEFEFTDIFNSMTLEFFSKVIGITYEIENIENYFHTETKDLPIAVREVLFKRRSYAQRLHVVMSCLSDFGLLHKDVRSFIPMNKKQSDTVLSCLSASAKVIDRRREKQTIQEFSFTTLDDVNLFWEELRRIGLKEIELKKQSESNALASPEPGNIDDATAGNVDGVIDLRNISKAMNPLTWVHTSLNNINYRMRYVLEQLEFPKSFQEIYLIAKRLSIHPQHVEEYYRQLKFSEGGTLIRKPAAGLKTKRNSSKQQRQKRAKKREIRIRRPGEAAKAKRTRFILRTAEDYETEYEFDPVVHSRVSFPSKKENSSRHFGLKDIDMINAYVTTIAERNKNSTLPLTELVKLPQDPSFWLAVASHFPPRRFRNNRCDHLMKRILLHYKNRLSVSVQLYDQMSKSRDNQMQYELPSTLNNLFDNFQVCQTYFQEDNIKNSATDFSTEETLVYEFIQQVVLSPHRDMVFHELQNIVCEFDKKIIREIVANLIRREVTITTIRSGLPVPDRTKEFEVSYYLVSETLLELFLHSRESIFEARTFSPQFFYYIQFIAKQFVIREPMMNNQDWDFPSFEVNPNLSGSLAAAVIGLVVNDKISLDILPKNAKSWDSLMIEPMQARHSCFVPPFRVIASSKEISFIDDPIASFRQFPDTGPIDLLPITTEIDSPAEILNTTDSSPDRLEISSDNQNITDELIQVSDTREVNNSQLGKRTELESPSSPSEPPKKQQKTSSDVSIVERDSNNSTENLRQANTTQKTQTQIIDITNNERTTMPPPRIPTRPIYRTPISSIETSKKTSNESIEIPAESSIESELQKLNNFLDAITYENSEPLKICSRELLKEIYQKESEGVSVSEVASFSRQNLAQYSADMIDASLMVLMSCKIIMSAVKGSDKYFISRAFVNERKWFSQIKISENDQQKEFLLSPWFQRGSLNPFVRGATIRVLRYILRSPGISLFSLCKSMPLLSMPRVLELVILLLRGNFIKWKTVQSQTISLFSSPSAVGGSVPYSPSITEAKTIPPRELFLIPTRTALLFNDTSLHQ